jgi:hypothetical protein
MREVAQHMTANLGDLHRPVRADVEYLRVLLDRKRIEQNGEDH